ncbi:hypothetical protein GCM10010106_35190 [Thermopolyspora flexuosa]|jgi:hypothetical protein|uniref:DUF6286 domain-containing protein n=1 Tax=Thermopolyspora flexuosa TaxID=103836 RepID=A0A543J191_9ACTN|nr:DUF6286 domain-containing protein [Thermopolyspora flexuosa]TQM76575.1 hypothetical protein FHX40_3319 [Thermopolyspora flexuosa]GGM85215.1 hypothetical protein GCM10010106_35190 [Thermopolyspora flexuosa]
MRESSGEWDREPLWRAGAERARLFGDAVPDGPRGGLRNAPAPESGQEPDARVSQRALRPGRTPAGILVALLVSVAGWAVTAELISLMLGGRPRWGPLDRIGAIGARTWGDPLVGVLACLFVLGGVALVVHALTPGRPRLIPLRTRDPLLAVGLTRAGLRRALTAAVYAVDDVDAARVVVRPDRIEVLVRGTAGRTGELLPQVAAAVGDTLVRIGAEARREVVLRVQAGRG